jgi:hypothetical protein
LPGAGACIAVALCLALAGGAGFPVDDAWIHQDFARTLATTGHFAFQPGRGGAGSTSPGWVLLLVLPQLLTHGEPPLWLVVGWVALLGAVLLGSLGVLTGVAAGDLARRTGAGEHVVRLVAAVAGLAVATEWHLVWAAVSGMETDLFALLALGLIVLANRGAQALWLGLLAGLTVAVRPEGGLVAALVLAGSAWSGLRSDGDSESRAEMPRRARLARMVERARAWLRGWLLPFAVGAGAGVLPYLTLNLAASGHALPSTLYAKQASVAGGAATLAGVLGYAREVGVVMVIVNPVLLAIAALAGVQPVRALLRGRAAWRARSRAEAAGRGRAAGTAAGSYPLGTLLWLWPVSLVAGYATHLPGAWQYGRYLMPALPPLLALAATWTAPLFQQLRRPLALIGGALLAAGALSLYGGARLYAGDVRAIDNYHVAAARWLRAHSPPGALVATHDVGAIGYFSGRPVLDMAGLVDPQVIPLVHDQAALEAYLVRRHVAYVVMRPDWFPPPELLAHDLAGHEVYRACGLGFCFVVYRTGW